MAATIDARRFLFLGGHPALDFANTLARSAGRDIDFLASFEDLVAWCTAANLVDGTLGEHLARQWRGQPPAARALAKALDLRQAIRDVVTRRSAGRPAASDSLGVINRMLRQRVGSMEVVRTRRGYEKRVRPRLERPEDLTALIAEAAAGLVCDIEPTLIRKCASPECVLHFYDTTKNHRRRWCSMRVCGNRAKARAAYRRQREA